MKFLYLGMIVVFVCIMVFLNPSNSNASTCTVKETIYSAPQFFLLSDNVFAGTVTSITDYGNHQWQVHFNIEKIWKGVATRQTSTVMTNTLQGCGYSITVGEKYLIYTNGSPSFINLIYSKTYSDAQKDIALFDDPQFQSQEQVKEDLNKKLEAAQGRVGSMMMDKSSYIPINGVGVDQVNSTLDIVIDDEKATRSIGQYRQNLKEILGDIPIKVGFGHATASTPILHRVNDQVQTIHPIIPTMPSPLQQFKSGIAAKDVTCKQGFQLILKGSDGNPTCIRNNSVSNLIERPWATRTINVEDSDLSISYSMAGGSITTSKMDTQSKILVISINSRSDGTLIITIPRALLDTVKNQRGEGQFIMLEDGKEITFKQIHTTISNKTFSIPFQNGTSTIEIIATELV